MTTTDNLDQRIAELVYARPFDPRTDRWSSDPEVAQELVERMSEGGITARSDGTSVSLYRGKHCLVTATAPTTLVALAKAVVKLVEDGTMGLPTP